MDTTRTASSSLAAVSKSFNTCWKVLACEIPCSSTVWTEQRPEPVSRDGRYRSGSALGQPLPDRKSTRLNSSHLVISYAVFCLKKKKNSNFFSDGGIYTCTSWVHLSNHINR